MSLGNCTAEVITLGHCLLSEGKVVIKNIMISGEVLKFLYWWWILHKLHIMWILQEVKKNCLVDKTEFRGQNKTSSPFFLESPSTIYPSNWWRYQHAVKIANPIDMDPLPHCHLGRVHFPLSGSFEGVFWVSNIIPHRHSGLSRGQHHTTCCYHVLHVQQFRLDWHKDQSTLLR